MKRLLTAIIIAILAIVSGDAFAYTITRLYANVDGSIVSNPGSKQSITVSSGSTTTTTFTAPTGYTLKYGGYTAELLYTPYGGTETSYAKYTSSSITWPYNTTLASAVSVRLITYYTSWTYYISYNVNGGSWDGSAPSATSAKYADDVDLEYPEATKAGYYTNNRWNTNSSGTGDDFYGGETVTGEDLGITSAGQTKTLYVKWIEAEKVTIYFDDDGGSGGPDSVEATPGLSMPTISSIPTAVGRTFNGYYSGSTGSGTKYYNASGTSAHTCDLDEGDTLSAYWTWNTITISYQGNGNTGGYTSIQQYEYGDSVTIKSSGFTRGYTMTFDNDTGEATYTRSSSDTVKYWNTNSSGTGTAYYQNYTYSNGIGITSGTGYLYAIWNNNLYITLPTPTRSGYKFLGWYTGSGTSGTKIGNGGDSYYLNSAQTAYAHWEIDTVTVSFDTHGGSSVNSVSAQSSVTISTSPSTSRENYTFSGWYGTSSYTEPSVSFPATFTSSTTLHAKWTGNQYSVTFNPNGGTGGGTTTVTYPATVSAYASPSWMGRLFSGWYDFGGSLFYEHSPTSNETWYARWTTNKVVVSFNSNGGSSVSPVTNDIHVVISESPSSTRSGYDFVGWYTNSVSVESNKVSFPFDTYENITLIAKWNKHHYNVYFRNCTYEGDVISVGIGDSFDVQPPDEVFETSGYFAGWQAISGVDVGSYYNIEEYSSGYIFDMFSICGYDPFEWGWLGSPVTFYDLKNSKDECVTLLARWYMLVRGIASPSSGGTVSGSDYLLLGESVTLTAIPASGYEFYRWSDGNTNNPRKAFATTENSDGLIEYTAEMRLIQ